MTFMSCCAALVPVMGLGNLCEVEVVSCIHMLGFHASQGSLSCTTVSCNIH